MDIPQFAYPFVSWRTISGFLIKLGNFVIIKEDYHIFSFLQEQLLREFKTNAWKFYSDY